MAPFFYPANAARKGCSRECSKRSGAMNMQAGLHNDGSVILVVALLLLFNG